jgi:hypothetical protein
VGRPVWLRDPANVRLVRLFLDKGDGHWTKAELLRPAAWAAMGQKVWLGLPEMGAVGWAEVRAVEPCPELPPGAGPVTTGLFHHSKGTVYNLLVEGEPEPLGVTPTHPFWSHDRQAYVPAGELREGERLHAADGSTPRVRGFTKRPQEEEVYNVEVAGDHCYRVGEQGLLVHNISAECQPGPNQLPDCNSADPETDPDGLAKAFFRDVCSGVAGLSLGPRKATAATTPVTTTCPKELPGGKRYTGVLYEYVVTPVMMIPGTNTPISVHVTCCDCCDRKCNKTMECLNAHWGSDRVTGTQGCYRGCLQVPGGQRC